MIKTDYDKLNSENINYKSKISQENKLINLLLNEIDDLTEKIEQQCGNVKIKIGEKNSHIESIQNDYETMSNKVNELEIKKLNNDSELYNDQIKKNLELTNKNTELQNIIEFMKTQIENSDLKLNQYKELIDDLNKNHSNIVEQYKSDIKILNEDKTRHEIINDEIINSERNEITKLNKQIDNFEIEIEKLNE